MDPIEKNKKGKRGIFGLVVGGAIGLFSASVFAWLNGVADLFYMFHIIGLVLGLFLGNVIAKMIKGVPAAPVVLSILLIFVLWPIATFGPDKFEEYRQKRLMSGFEMYPGATLDREEIVLYGWDHPERGISKALTVPLGTSEDRILEFYSNQYKNKGWTVTENKDPSNSYWRLHATKKGLTSNVTIYYRIKLGLGYITESKEEAFSGANNKLGEEGTDEEYVSFSISTLNAIFY